MLVWASQPLRMQHRITRRSDPNSSPTRPVNIVHSTHPPHKHSQPSERAQARARASRARHRAHSCEPRAPKPCGPGPGPGPGLGHGLGPRAGRHRLATAPPLALLLTDSAEFRVPCSAGSVTGAGAGRSCGLCLHGTCDRPPASGSRIQCRGAFRRLSLPVVFAGWCILSACTLPSSRVPSLSATSPRRRL